MKITPESIKTFLERSLEAGVDDSLVAAVMDVDRPIHHIVRSVDPSGQEFPLLFNLVLDVRNSLIPPTKICCTPTLDEVLHVTDVASDMPVSSMRLPYKHMFMVLPDRNVVRGVYVSEFVWKSGNGRTIELTFSDHPEVEVPTRIYPMGIDVPNGDKTTLSKLLQSSSHPSRQYTDAPTLHVAKVLLYMNCAQARMQRVGDRAGIQKQLDACKSGSKRAKLQRKLEREPDYILVGPTTIPSAAHGHSDSSGRAPHWRRGHFRNQAHGHRMELRKVVFIEPVLINADAIAGEAPETKPYKVAL